MSKPELKITADGSHTLFVPDLDETYHSVHGAVQEAMHVFIRHGLTRMKHLQELSILEMGLGTGLNAFLTLREGKAHALSINYTALEAFPLQEELVNQLNFIDQLQADCEEKKSFAEIHRCPWGSTVSMGSGFELTKLHAALEDFEANQSFDLIYFDAFGPRVQPELWEVHVFEKMYRALKPGGLLVTYCAKGSVKRALKQVGFLVTSLPGPPGKREMTSAQKP